ncbi:MAG: thioesterase family protein [Acidimicrobiia bacterium]
MVSPITRTFRIRRYECDAYGHVNNTTYLRYLEEAEFEAGLRPNGDPRLRTTDIEFVEPLAFGEEVTVTALTDTDEPLRRAYEFHRDADLVARARALWATPGSHRDPSDRIPDPPDAPEAVFIQTRPVEWRDVDEQAQVSPATLSAFAEDCGVDLCAAYGWPMERCTAAGFAMILRRHQIAYGEPMALGDELEIRTWASDMRRVMAIRHYLISAGGKLVARFRSQYVWVDIETYRPIRIPADFISDFRPNFSAGASPRQ